MVVPLNAKICDPQGLEQNSNLQIRRGNLSVKAPRYIPKNVTLIPILVTLIAFWNSGHRPELCAGQNRNIIIEGRPVSVAAKRSKFTFWLQLEPP
jgi:hypothetical protein